jgi:hypothetical protein
MSIGKGREKNRVSSPNSQVRSDLPKVLSASQNGRDKPIEKTPLTFTIVTYNHHLHSIIKVSKTSVSICPPPTQVSSPLLRRPRRAQTKAVFPSAHASFLPKAKSWAAAITCACKRTALPFTYVKMKSKSERKRSLETSGSIHLDINKTNNIKPGRDLRPRERRPPARFRLQGSNDVHHALALRHVHRCLHSVQD